MDPIAGGLQKDPPMHRDHVGQAPAPRLTFSRRGFGAAIAAAAATHGAAAHAAPGPAITIYKSNGCTCCEGWIAHMKGAGYRPKVIPIDNLMPVWRRHGVPDELSSCHLGLVGGYVTVGHVPAADVSRMLREKPKAIGLTVAGMPIGSPGMESNNGKREAFDTLLLLPGGKTRVYARYAKV